ncbi:MAG: hypothetical protein PUE25_09960 [bacterium]|nr:hypothetical protein [bacterium]
MRKIIVILILALLAGGVEAKTPRKTKRSKQRTTLTKKKKTNTRRAPKPIDPPQRTPNYFKDEEAQRWYQKALAGNAEYQYFTAYHWTNGDFGEVDYDEALRWYYLSAQQGYADAEMTLGHAYEDEYDVEGYHLKPNYFEAAKWYARAKAHGDRNADYYLGALLNYGYITKEEFRIVTEQAGLDSQSARQEALAEQARVAESNNNDKKYAHFYGTWTSARGTTFTISKGPYLDLVGAGKFSGEWTNDGKLYVSFGYPDEITLRYYNGYLYDGNGRMHWRIGQ